MQVKRFYTAALLSLALAGVSWANIIPTGARVTGAGIFTWNYTLTLSADQNALSGPAPTTNPVGAANTTGAFFTLYDFAGYIAGSCAGPSGWTCTNQALGFTPFDVAPLDSAAFTNITWTYTTGPTIVGGNGAGAGTELGNFSAQTNLNISKAIAYTARGVKNNGPAAGTTADNIGTTTGPSGIPEQISISLIGIGLVGIGIARKRTRSV